MIKYISKNNDNNNNNENNKYDHTHKINYYYYFHHHHNNNNLYHHNTNNNRNNYKKNSEQHRGKVSTYLRMIEQVLVLVLEILLKHLQVFEYKKSLLFSLQDYPEIEIRKLVL